MLPVKKEFRLAELKRQARSHKRQFSYRACAHPKRSFLIAQKRKLPVQLKRDVQTDIPVMLRQCLLLFDNEWF